MLLDYTTVIKTDLQKSIPYCDFGVCKRFLSNKRRFMYNVVLNSGPVAIEARNTFMIVMPSGGIPGGLNKENKAETFLLTKLGAFVAETEYTITINLSNEYKVITSGEWEKAFALALLKTSKS